jgi:hypothetical protein
VGSVIGSVPSPMTYPLVFFIHGKNSTFLKIVTKIYRNKVKITINTMIANLELSRVAGRKVKKIGSWNLYVIAYCLCEQIMHVKPADNPRL